MTVTYFEGLLGWKRDQKCRESITEYCIKLWHPHFHCGLKKKLERAQRRAARMKKSLKNLLCDDRLKEFNLFSSSENKLRGDLIVVSKYLQGGDF